MNAKLLLVLFMVAVLVLPDADAFWGRRFRIRIPIRRFCNNVCKQTGCRLVRRGGRWVKIGCKTVCNKICKFGKREEDDGINEEPENPFQDEADEAVERTYEENEE